MEHTEHDNAYHKFHSVKFWIAVWAAAIFSFIVISGTEVPECVYKMLGLILLGYMGANVWQKSVLKDNGE